MLVVGGEGGHKPSWGGAEGGECEAAQRLSFIILSI